MSYLATIIEALPDQTFLKADGFDEAVIGLEISSMRLIYSVTKCLNILEKEMTREEAGEHLWFNVQGAIVGPQTPIWCDDTWCN